MSLETKLKKPLRILFLEDSPMDAELMREYLKGHFKHEFHLEVITLKSAFLSAISSKQYDIILSDYNLPDFNGLFALEQAKSFCPLTPFIIVSGTIGEEKAVELLKQGAIDYILKGKLERLISAMERALKGAEEAKKLKQYEKNLLESQRIAHLGTWRADLQTDEIVWSVELYNIFGFDPSLPPPILSESINLFTADSWEIFSNAINNAISKGIEYELELEIVTKKGLNKWVWAHGEPEMDEKNNIIAIWGAVQDITDWIQKQKEIEFVSSHDYLTKLYNRRYYFKQLNQHDKPQYYPLGVMMLDVNGLKIINDAFGHGIGDVALKTFGEVLKDSFEEKDIVSRIGGDEFAVLLPNTTSEKLQEYKEQIALVIKTKKIENVELSLAIGYELKNSIQDDADEIIKLAENQMYRHKTIEGSSVRSHAINAILQTLTEKYETERKHSVEVSDLCKLTGEQLKLRKDEIIELEQAGMFHDIGKISLPDRILNKPGKLTNEEFDVIKTHTEIGYQILRAADEYSDLAIHALHHHERWDGRGYPRGLKGKDIPLFSRIICVVDAYEAMTSDRPYRKKMSKEYAISEIKKYSGTQFDPKITEIFLEKVVPQLI